MSKVDLNRGVMTSRQKASDGGIYINMYVDEPGIYFDNNGNPVPEQLAADVGFDVQRFAKERRKSEALNAFKSQLALEMEAQTEGSTSEIIILAERAGYKVRGLPDGQYADVLDPDGNILNSNPLPAVMAQTLLGKLTAGRG